MRLVNDKQQLIVPIPLQPRLGVCPNFTLPWPEQHIFQHGVVCNEDIRAELLHFKPGHQLGILLIGNMPAMMELFKKFLKILFRGQLSVFDQLL